MIKLLFSHAFGNGVTSFLTKATLGAILALAALTSLASPAREERSQFCAATAQTAYEVILLREQGMPKETFDKGLAALLLDLDGQLSKSQLEEVKHFLQEAYVSQGSPSGTARRIFEACMNQKIV